MRRSDSDAADTADRDYAAATRRAEELADDGNNVADIMDLLDDEWLGSTIWPSSSSQLWHDVERIVSRARQATS